MPQRSLNNLRSFQIVCAFLSLFAVVAVSGCGGSDIEKMPVFSASGNLTMDGKPFGPATLRFVPSETARSFVAVADAGGKLSDFTTYKKGDGAPAGTYKVAVYSSGGTSAPIPAIYEDEKNTPLTVIISDITGDDANTLTIDLDSKAGKPSPNSTMRGFTAKDFEAAKGGITD